MKLLLIILFLLIPLHALIVTFLKCKVGIDTNLIRFWKEFIILTLLIITFFETLRRYKFKISKIYKGNYLLGTITVFIITSLIYLFFPFFELKASAFLGFKYDVFFLFALIIGLYLPVVRKNLDILLKIFFGVVGLILIIFLPWYVFGDIGSLAEIFGYSSKVSTYEANSCISFAQNVNGQHRFQGTFGGPIRFSVFLATFYFLYIGFILDKKLFLKGKILSDKILLLLIPSLFIITSIFFSYSKTSILGLVLGAILFIYLVRKIKYKKSINKKFIAILGLVGAMPIIIVGIFKKDLFLHLGSVLNRFDNLGKSVEMFFYNPIGYGLGIAGPASQIGKSIESAGSWQIATTTVTKTHKFLPENWYIQVLLEQGLVGFFLFISILIIIGFNLYRIVKNKKDYLSIGIFVAFFILCFMAMFTHSFEESATSYILFLIIGAWITKNRGK